MTARYPLVLLRIAPLNGLPERNPGTSQVKKMPEIEASLLGSRWRARTAGEMPWVCIGNGKYVERRGLVTCTVRAAQSMKGAPAPGGSRTDRLPTPPQGHSTARSPTAPTAQNP